METCQHLVQISGQLVAKENPLGGNSVRPGVLFVSSGYEKALNSHGLTIARFFIPAKHSTG